MNLYYNIYIKTNNDNDWFIHSNFLSLHEKNRAVEFLKHNRSNVTDILIKTFELREVDRVEIKK